ncbi:hypothetical protein QE152_g40147 [Popillia japonica]|uniref:Retroviral polymerase SH3-like domain-containing protein n=1 Tax=Popillia japonica TaxID=7064 RepID=A0AAW1HSE3_POPJA
MFIDYASHGYRLWDKTEQSVIIARDVVFQKNKREEEVKQESKGNATVFEKYEDDKEIMDEEGKTETSSGTNMRHAQCKNETPIHSADDSHSAADQTGLGQSVLGRTGTSSPTNPQQNPSSRRCPELPKRSLRAPVASPSSRSLQNTKAKISAPTSAPANDKIPPIVLRDKTAWAKLNAEIKRKGINFTKPQNISDGIRIFPSTESDYRAITKLFSTGEASRWRFLKRKFMMTCANEAFSQTVSLEFAELGIKRQCR